MNFFLANEQDAVWVDSNTNNCLMLLTIGFAQNVTDFAQNIIEYFVVLANLCGYRCTILGVDKIACTLCIIHFNVFEYVVIKYMML